jgi:hypothetical protein
MFQIAKIAVYTANECRYFELFWSNRRDAMIVKEDDKVIMTHHKSEATLRDALQMFGLDNKNISLWEPNLISQRDINDHLSRVLYTLRSNRIILSQQGCTFAGKPAMIGW